MTRQDYPFKMVKNSYITAPNVSEFNGSGKTQNQHNQSKTKTQKIEAKKKIDFFSSLLRSSKVRCACLVAWEMQMVGHGSNGGSNSLTRHSNTQSKYDLLNYLKFRSNETPFREEYSSHRWEPSSLNKIRPSNIFSLRLADVWSISFWRTRFFFWIAMSTTGCVCDRTTFTKCQTLQIAHFRFVVFV